MEFEGFCVKEKATRKAINAQEILTKNARRALKGTCSSCGSTMMKFLPSERKQ